MSLSTALSAGLCCCSSGESCGVSLDSPPWLWDGCPEDLLGFPSEGFPEDGDDCAGEDSDGEDSDGEDSDGEDSLGDDSPGEDSEPSSGFPLGEEDLLSGFSTSAPLGDFFEDPSVSAIVSPSLPAESAVRC
uniref:hypothetical protein n=1 Tax=Bythopirellula polymerisocia TaxID=2528003 RepID=UPI0011B6B239